MIHGSGLSQRLFGTITRPNGDQQATYRHHPLYISAAHNDPHDAFTDMTGGFGGAFFLVGIRAPLIRCECGY